MKTLKAFFLELCTNNLDSQKQDGSMCGGNNGPHGDKETPVRNTSHWAISFLKAYKLSNDDEFLNASKKCFAYLLDDIGENRSKFNFKHRNSKVKDNCNGLIGAAWNIEALVYGYEYFGAKEYLDLAKELFLIHPFDEEFLIWNRIEVNGRNLGPDLTFNHQLWFAMSGLLISQYDNQVGINVEKFLSNLNNYFRVSNSGRIFHPIYARRSKTKDFLKRWVKRSYRDSIFEKEIGYQTFNLYALGVIKKIKPSLKFFNSKKASKALSFISSDSYLELIESNKYSFAYNAPGFEIPFIQYSFNEYFDEPDFKWLNKQIQITYFGEEYRFSRNTPDPLTLTARVYELTKLPNEYFDRTI